MDKRVSIIHYKGQEVLPAKRDLVFKALMTADGDLELLASLLSCILEIDIHAHDIIVTNTEFAQVHQKGKLTRIDVRAKLSDGQHVNIEVQFLSEISDNICYPENYVIREDFHKALFQAA